MKIPQPISYMLLIQCVREEIGMLAEYHATTPFPSFQKGGSLTLADCYPTIWDITDRTDRIASSPDGAITCCTFLLVDSGVVENRGTIVKKSWGEEVGPSETRFGRIKQ
jgi:hypothetical protein